MSHISCNTILIAHFCLYMQLSICGFELCHFAKNLFYVCFTNLFRCEVKLGVQTYAIQSLSLDEKILYLSFIVQYLHFQMMTCIGLSTFLWPWTQQNHHCTHFNKNENMSFDLELITVNPNLQNQVLCATIANGDSTHNKNNANMKQLSLIKAQPKKINANINRCKIWILKALTTFWPCEALKL